MKTLFIGEISSLQLGKKKRQREFIRNVAITAFYLSVISLIVFDSLMTLIAHQIV